MEEKSQEQKLKKFKNGNLSKTEKNNSLKSGTAEKRAIKEHEK